MIIDVHCHLWERDMIPEKFWRDTAAMISRMVPGSTIESILNSELLQKSMGGFEDRLLAEMDEARIDKTVVFGTDWGLLLGEPKISIEDYNKFIADTAKEYSDKLIPFFSIDPRRPKSAEMFETALTKWEMRGLKLHPSTGYLPDGKECYQLYKVADRYKVPVITHSGYIMGLRGRTARPEYFDAPTTDFPNVKFCFAHLNYGVIDDLINMMNMKPNTYCDISAHGQLLMMNSPPDLYRQLRFAMNFEGVSHRVMFGSDWPILTLIMPLSKWVDTIQNFTNPKITTILEHFGYRKFSNKEIKLILGKNAERYLKL